MAWLRMGTLLHVWRAFGCVCFMVRWDTGERKTIVVPKRDIDPTLRAGDRVGTVETAGGAVGRRYYQQG